MSKIHTDQYRQTSVYTDIFPIGQYQSQNKNFTYRVLDGSARGKSLVELGFSPLRYYKPRAAIYSQGDPSHSLFYVNHGCVRVSSVTVEGRRQVCAFYFSGEFFGFEGGKIRKSCADTLEKSGLQTLNMTNITLQSEKVIELYLDYLETIQEQTFNLVTRNALGRVAMFLTDIAKRQGDADTIRLPMSRLDIADHLGLTLETVSRSMHRLQEIGAIEMVSARRLKVFKSVMLSVLLI